MKKNNITINVLDGIPNAKTIFAISGRDLGIKQRKHHKLNELEKQYEEINVNIDENIIFLSSSFFLGMFGDSVRYCKNKEKFKEKFKFKMNEELIVNIEDGINDALRDINPLV